MSAAPAVDVIAARFKVGDAVRVLKAFPPGHIRTPFFIRGCKGTIDAVCGAYPNPEELAYLRPGLPAQPLYRVRFIQRDIWPDYDGSASDSVVIDIYQHWLEPA
jgi:nitrile hydratase